MFLAKEIDLGKTQERQVVIQALRGIFSGYQKAVRSETCLSLMRRLILGVSWALPVAFICVVEPASRKIKNTVLPAQEEHLMMSKRHLFSLSVLGKCSLWNGIQFSVGPELSGLARQVMIIVVVCVVTVVILDFHFTVFVRGLYLECLG